ncbi:MAG: exo-alpha-sialidase [Spirochaetales bacterium]|jgi:sialidase-1|nr:exo-alpha-sialidase [Spirochaetales bacterium]
MKHERFMIAEGTDEHPRNDSATTVELPDGTLFMIWMEFMASEWVSGDEAPNHLVSKRSADAGKTWGDFRVEVETAPGDKSVYNSSLLLLPENELLFFYIRYNHLVWGDPLEVSGYMKRSKDGGRTWTPPVAMWERDSLCGAHDTLLRLKDGRLLKPVERMPVWCTPPTGVSSSGCLFSDDNGYTWTESPDWIRLPLRGSMEAHIAEASDGRLVMAVRNDLGSVFLSSSFDRGESWSKAQSTGLSSPESMPVIKTIPGSGDLILIWNNSEYDPGFVSHFGKRTPLTAAISRDCGETWECRKNLIDDPTLQISNPACVFTSAGTAFITYFTSPMDDPVPPGKWGSNLMSLEATIVDIDWLYR